MPPALSRRRLLGLGGLAVAGATATGAAAPSAATGRVREHWIAARNARWPVCPTGRDAWHGHRVPRATMDALVYVACTPGWRRPLRAAGIGDNAGIPGPVLRARPGDVLRVHFRNEDRVRRLAHTMHPHG